MEKELHFYAVALKIMRITITQIVFAVVLVSVSWARDGRAQEVLKRRLTLSVEEQTIKSVLHQIERATEARFLYSSSLINTGNKVSIQVENKALGEVLETLLSPFHVGYKTEGRQIILIRSPYPPRESVVSEEIVVPQLAKVSGKITDEKDEAMIGVTVAVKGTTRGVITDIDGRYEIEVPDENAVLVYSFVGYKPREERVGNRTVIDIRLEAESNQLSEVVVTGYTSQKKKDVIGAVSVVKTSELLATPSSNIMAQLQGRSAGVTVSSTGNPGGAANVRIRGFASYGNNNPLYIIDGVPTTDASRINPQDVESLQVLKDASAASIYGARAANGVIIITTKQGKAGRTSVSYDSYVGVNSLPYNQFPEMLNTAETMQYLDRTTAPGHIDPLFGTKGAFRVPDYYVVSNNFRGGVSAGDPRLNPDLYTIADYKNTYQIFKTSPGTDWFRAMSQKGIQQSHQLSASGGTEKSQFSMGLNYFNEEGMFKFTGYERYTARVNSSFSPTKYLRLGENIQVAYDNRKGDNTVSGETTAWANSYRSAPFIPVYDIMGGYGGSLIGSTAGVGWNPVAVLERRKDWTSRSLRVFGNLFAEINLAKDLVARTSVGIDAGNGSMKQALLREYERAEARSVTQLTEGASSYTSVTWSNTLAYQKRFGEIHDLKLLAGTESIKNQSRRIEARVSNYDFEDNDFMSLSTGLPKTLGDISATTPNIAVSTLFSYFGRVDYNLKDKYLFNATFRRDGSSLFGPTVRYANFPSVGAGWRISDEAFMKNIPWMDELKLRAGWGIMGSISNVPAFNQFSSYGSAAAANFYDLNAGNIGSTQGYGATRQGNLMTKWESTQTTNIGIDASLMRGKWNASIDVYSKNTSDLLVPSLRNGMEPIITKPLINLGTMNNKGVDIQLGNRGNIGSELKYDVSLTFTRYKNLLTKLNNENTAAYVSSNRMANILITTKGQAVSSFYGYQIDGFYNSQEEVNNGPKINGAPGQVGTWKYKDIDGDGNITVNDRTVLGTPHPDFQMGLNIGLKWKSFDFSGFLFWNQGNEIFNYTKFLPYMGVIGGGIARGKLYDAWTPETAQTAKTPMLGVGTSNGYTSFVTGNSSSFYVEDGSFLRAKTIQLGYTLPVRLLHKAEISNVRVYVQAQNLFTITKYTGADPDLGLVSSDNTDQNLGVDYSGFPNPRQLLVGLSISF